jgi:hypothetical protein
LARRVHAAADVGARIDRQRKLASVQHHLKNHNNQPKSLGMTIWRARGLSFIVSYLLLIIISYWLNIIS